MSAVWSSNSMPSGLKSTACCQAISRCEGAASGRGASNMTTFKLGRLIGDERGGPCSAPPTGVRLGWSRSYRRSPIQGGRHERRQDRRRKQRVDDCKVPQVRADPASADDQSWERSTTSPRIYHDVFASLGGPDGRRALCIRYKTCTTRETASQADRNDFRKSHVGINSRSRPANFPLASVTVAHHMVKAIITGKRTCAN